MYIQYAGSPDIFDEQGNYVPTLDWSKNPQITKVNTPRPDVKTEADFKTLAGKSINKGTVTPPAPDNPVTPPPTDPTSTLATNADPVQAFITAYSNSDDPLIQAQIASLKASQELLTKLTTNGQTVNPNVQITPDLAAQFLAQAQQETSADYSNQLKIARQGLLQNIGYSADQITAQEGQWERQYGQNVRKIGETAADTGMALSGGRQLNEQNLAQDTQYQIDQARKGAQFNAQQSAQQYAQQYGGANVPTVNIAQAPRVLAGQSSFVKDATQTPFYSLSPDVYQGLVGSQEKQRSLDTTALQQSFEKQYLADQATNTRRLTL